jgi:hypothetical protein
MVLELVSYKGGVNIEGVAEQGTEKSIWIQERWDYQEDGQNMDWEFS